MRIGKRELTMAITAAAMTLALAGCMAGNNDSAGTTSPTAGGASTAAPGAGSDAGGSDNGAGAGGGRRTHGRAEFEFGGNMKWL